MKYWNATLRITHGCTPAGRGCRFCWSAREAFMRQFNPLVAARYRGLLADNDNPTFNGKVTVHPENLDRVLTTKQPRVWAIWNDLFHDAVPDDVIRSVFATACMKKDHKFIALTKRPKRMLELSHWMYVPENMYLGVSVSSYKDQDGPFECLVATNAPSKTISAEPCVGRIDLRPALMDKTVKLVVAGGESGPKSKVAECPEDAIWNMMQACADAGVCFFFKQWGAHRRGHLLGGKEYLQLPWVL
jgi:protein gp37